MRAHAEALRRENRLLRRHEFRHAARHGWRVQVQGFLLILARRETQDPAGRVRLGVAVSRQVGKAVVRNRVKRRIREWFRRERRQMRQNLDVVVVAQRTAAGLSQQESRRELEEGARKAGLWT